MNPDYEYEFWTDAAGCAPGEWPAITKLIARDPMRLPTSTVDELKRRANSNLPGRFHVQQRGLHWDRKTELLQVELSSGWVLRWQEWGSTPALYRGSPEEHFARVARLEYLAMATTSFLRVPGLPPVGYDRIACLTMKQPDVNVVLGRTS